MGHKPHCPGLVITMSNSYSWLCCSLLCLTWSALKRLKKKKTFQKPQKELCKSLHCAEKLMWSSKSSQRNDSIFYFCEFKGFTAIARVWVTVFRDAASFFSTRVWAQRPNCPNRLQPVLLGLQCGLNLSLQLQLSKKRETRQLNFGFEFICQSERAPTVFSDILFDLKLRINLNISYFLQKDWEDNICLSFIICFFPYNNDFLSHCMHECILLGRQKKVFLTWYIIKWAFKRKT